jgi:hypothetical protein
MNKAQQIKSQNAKIIGIWGYPDPEIFMQIRQKYPNFEIIDLDVDYDMPSSNILPDAYCRIMKNILDNAVALKDNLEIIIAAVGEEKCDAGRFAAKILEDMSFNVVQTRYNESVIRLETPVSTSNLPLKDKIVTIMDRVVDGIDSSALSKNENSTIYVPPQYGFWGVPPNDLSFLELFPNTTHVYGWTRCVEAGRPADMDLEMFVDKSIPTVFFAQAFCAKMQLAKYLAKKNDGLYVDVDDKASNSVKAKIEAFIKLG